MLKAEKLCYSYGNRSVLKNISFEADYGQFISVLGPNGVGKSTLFRCMLGLLSPNSGGVSIDGKSVKTLTAPQLARIMAYIPQMHQAVFNYSVFEMVLMGTTAQRGDFSSPGKKQIELAEQALEKLGLSHLKTRSYGKLSGGERQLTLIARALAQQARILIMDEPSASLDFGNRIRVMETIRELTKEGYCVIQSTHDPEQAYFYSDKILAIHDGEVLAMGSPAEIINKEIVSTLYGCEVQICSLQDDRLRVCVPQFIGR